MKNKHYTDCTLTSFEIQDLKENYYAEKSAAHRKEFNKGEELILTNPAMGVQQPTNYILLKEDVEYIHSRV